MSPSATAAEWRRYGPFFYQVASELRGLLDLPREEQLGIWRRVVGRYQSAARALPGPLQSLCEEPFLDQLLEDDIFWGLVGPNVSRQFYAHATEFLPAVYAAAALVAARQDGLPLDFADAVRLSGGHRS